MSCVRESGYVFKIEVYCKFPNLRNSPAAVVDRLFEPLKGEGGTYTWTTTT